MQGADRKAKGTSDLGVRTASALVMVAVAGTAFWLGGWAWVAFVGLVAAVVLWEWRALARRFTSGPLNATVWDIAGVIYVGFAAAFLIFLRDSSPETLPMLVGAVIATDVGAYFAGRSIGGPKIAPSISPSKTWAGLAGGAIGAAMFVAVAVWAWHGGLCDTYVGNPLQEQALKEGKAMFDGPCSFSVPPLWYLAISSIVAGALIAIVAQSGDFFESWMKRRASVKDSSKLIPGHGGVFDRVDGLLAVVVAYAIVVLIVEAGSL